MTENALLAAQQRLDELAAESRVLQEGSRAMRQECNEAWVSTLIQYIYILDVCSRSCHSAAQHDSVHLTVVLPVPTTQVMPMWINVAHGRYCCACVNSKGKETNTTGSGVISAKLLVKLKPLAGIAVQRREEERAYSDAVCIKVPCAAYRSSKRQHAARWMA